jgi:hypothetical protein
MLDGVMLLWFVLAAASLLFVAVDIRTTPESSVMKWRRCAPLRLAPLRYASQRNV